MSNLQQSAHPFDRGLAMPRLSALRKNFNAWPFGSTRKGKNNSETPTQIHYCPMA